MSPRALLVAVVMAATACREEVLSVADATVDADAAVGVPVDATRADAKGAMDAAGDLGRDAVGDVRDAEVADVRDAADVSDAPDADLRPYDPCAPGAVRDLNALGTRTGATTRLVADNRSVGRMGPLDAPCARGYVGHQVAFRYVPRATTRLRVSTNDEATDARLDTVVFAVSQCGPVPDGGAALGCSDDTGDPPRDHATTFVTDANVRAGEPVYIVVSGFLHATSELWDSQGTFALSVTEL